MIQLAIRKNARHAGPSCYYDGLVICDLDYDDYFTAFGADERFGKSDYQPVQVASALQSGRR